MLEYRIAVGLAMLAYTSYFDVKSREVDDKPWILFSLLGGALTLYDILLQGGDWFTPLLSIGVTVPLAFAIYYTGLYGEADAKALVALSLILPVYTPPAYLHVSAPLIVFTNSILLVMVLLFYFFFRNFFAAMRGEDIFDGFEEEPLWKKTVALFVGCRLKNVKQGAFYFSLEKTVDGKRRFDFTFSKAGDEFVESNDVWATYGLPMLLFMTGGFVAMLLVGDIMIIFLRFVFSALGF